MYNVGPGTHAKLCNPYPRSDGGAVGVNISMVVAALGELTSSRVLFILQKWSRQWLWMVMYQSLWVIEAGLYGMDSREVRHGRRSCGEGNFVCHDK